jgi:MmyB-like transcription regulator ligand binding domain
VLKAHEPYPALTVDRHWTTIAANTAVATLLAEVDPDHEAAGQSDAPELASAGAGEPSKLFEKAGQGLAASLRWDSHGKTPRQSAEPIGGDRRDSFSLISLRR